MPRLHPPSSLLHKPLLATAFALAGALTHTPNAAGMECRAPRVPLAKDVAQAEVVLVGKLGNAREARAGNGAGTTECTIRRILKGRTAIGDQKTILIPRYIPNEKREFLIFADAQMGVLDVYRGIPLAGNSDEFPDYLEGAVAVSEAPPQVKLGYHFRYLNHANEEIAQDACLAFNLERPPELLAAVAHYDPDQLVIWLLDPRTPKWRHDLFGCLLGLCRRREDAVFLRQMFEERRETWGPLPGLLAGYCLTDHAEGVPYVAARLANAKIDFRHRYAALWALRFVLGADEDIDRGKVFEHMQAALPQPDFADLVIEDLRRFRHWDRPELVLDLYAKPALEPIVYRAVLRYALCCPDPRAKTLVAQAREKDSERVADLEELLRLERQSLRTEFLRSRWWLKWASDLEELLGVRPVFLF